MDTNIYRTCGSQSCDSIIHSNLSESPNIENGSGYGTCPLSDFIQFLDSLDNLSSLGDQPNDYHPVDNNTNPLSRFELFVNLDCLERNDLVVDSENTSPPPHYGNDYGNDYDNATDINSYNIFSMAPNEIHLIVENALVPLQSINYPFSLDSISVLDNDNAIDANFFNHPDFISNSEELVHQGSSSSPLGANAVPPQSPSSTANELASWTPHSTARAVLSCRFSHERKHTISDNFTSKCILSKRVLLSLMNQTSRPSKKKQVTHDPMMKIGELGATFRGTQFSANGPMTLLRNCGYPVVPCSRTLRPDRLYTIACFRGLVETTVGLRHNRETSDYQATDPIHHPPVSLPVPRRRHRRCVGDPVHVSTGRNTQIDLVIPFPSLSLSPPSTKWSRRASNSRLPNPPPVLSVPLPKLSKPKAHSPSALYRGIVPPILVEAPKRAIKFAANEQYTILYKGLFGIDRMTQGLSILTGVSAGVTEALVIVPFELVKIRLQDKANVG
ncbi:hypothetical protein BC937DRAFT_89883 [Endogone sp. FLAS-F59071]|nr:hypothetical protein BC937DRAFT_89883 [Endogone sp. FLAS-F59071]|eukprot:RUS22251.1 hypothetical protein BC937DRAFT_89883 [Endogone sp. FLAS-F59071]